MSAICLGVSISGDITLGELLVALGTGALAFFTWKLANQTSSEVKLTTRGLTLTRESVDLSREGIEASDRPWIILSPNDNYSMLGLIDLDSFSRAVALRLWNIGRGPAIVYEVSIRGHDGVELLPEERLIERPIAATSGLDGRDEVFTLSGAGPATDEVLRCRIDFRSASGARYRSESEVTVQAGGNWLCRDFIRRALPVGEAP